jgi:O-antigen/teichoic acid export membrane protein
MTPTLGRRIGGGLRWSMVNTIVGRVGQLLLGVALARLIAPAEFGVFAAALVAVTVISSISELGVSLALVRAEEREEADRLAPVVSTMSIASGLVLAGLMAAGAPLLATALGTADAAAPIRAMSLVLVTAGVAAVPAALLQREFHQGRKLIADTAAFAVSLVVAIALALAGFGVWALVWSRLSLHLVSAVLLFALAPSRPRPGFDRGIARELLRFGLPLAGASLVVLGLMNVDYAIVGRTLGPTALGLYVLAFNISAWPVNAFSTPVRAVSLPGFSQLGEARGARFGEALGLLLVPVVPACVLLGSQSGPLVRIVYGDRWAAAAAPLAYLVVLGAVRVVAELGYDFLVSAGAVRASFVLNVLWLASLVPALIIGAHAGGIAGVGVAHVVIALAVVLPAYGVVLARCGVAPASIARHTARPLAGGALMLAVALGAGSLVEGDAARLLLASPAAGLTYAAAVGLPLWRRHRRGELLPRAVPA